jgi:flagellar biosynthetic protein FliS
MKQSNDLSYRKSAIEGASPIGLVIALYDTLWGDLRRAAAAIRENDIEKRCRELNHAALVLGQLENWIDLKNGGELAKNLTQLYAYLRAKMMEASIAKSAPMLEAQMELILHVRTSWQQTFRFISSMRSAIFVSPFMTVVSSFSVIVHIRDADRRQADICE